MSTYRAVVHYEFKKGMEEEGIKFLERELVKKAQNYGCHEIELLHSEKNPCHLIGIATWKNIEEAKKFQATWDAKEKEILRYCTDVPKREFFKMRSTYTEKAKKAA